MKIGFVDLVGFYSQAILKPGYWPNVISAKMIPVKMEQPVVPCQAVTMNAVVHQVGYEPKRQNLILGTKHQHLINFMYNCLNLTDWLQIGLPNS